MAHGLQCFTMAMPFNMILYVIPCDYSKLPILYIHVHIFYNFYDK